MNKKCPTHSTLTFLINLRKSIAGIFLSRQYYINIVLTHQLSGPTGFVAAYFQHILLSLSLGLEYITDTLGPQINLLMVPQWHFFLSPITNHNWIHTTVKLVKYDSVQARAIKSSNSSIQWWQGLAINKFTLSPFAYENL